MTEVITSENMRGRLPLRRVTYQGATYQIIAVELIDGKIMADISKTFQAKDETFTVPFDECVLHEEEFIQLPTTHYAQKR